MTKHAEMSVQEWIAVPNNPRQRDTEAHLRKAKHLLTPSPTHSRVAMAVGADGARWKLDGHTRALAWQRGMIPRPAKVIVDLYPVKTAADAAELYRHFDNQAATETGADQIAGAWREQEFQPKSSLLRAGKLTSALRLAEGCARHTRMPARDISTYELVAKWRKELEMLDDLNPVRQRFPGTIVAAALMTFRKHGVAACEFWSRYSEDAGEKFENAMDAVETLSRFMLQARSASSGSHAATGAYDVVGKGLAAFEAHRQNRTYTRGFLGIDATKYLKRGVAFVVAA